MRVASLCLNEYAFHFRMGYFDPALDARHGFLQKCIVRISFGLRTEGSVERNGVDAGLHGGRNTFASKKRLAFPGQEPRRSRKDQADNQGGYSVQDRISRN